MKQHITLKSIQGLYGKMDKIPETWEFLILDSLTPLGDKTAIKMGPFGSDLKKQELLNEGEIKTLWIENIVQNKLNLDYKKFITKVKYQELKNFTVKENDIVLSMMGTVGRVAIIPNDIGTAIITSHLLKITLDQKRCFPVFLHYYFLSEIARNQLNRESRGLVMQGLNTGIIKSLKIALPSLKEQQKIASILSKVDELILKTDQIIEQTQRLKKGLMQKLLTKGIRHTKFKRVNLGINFLNYNIPLEWKFFNLGNIASVHGRIGWKGLKREEYTETGPLMLSVWSLIDNDPYGVDYTAGVNRLSRFRYDESPEIKLQNGDVLLAKDGDIGKIGYIKDLPEPSTVNSHIVVVRTRSNEIDSEFLYWYMNAHPFQSYCKSLTSGTTVPLLSQSNIRKAKIPVPSLKEQKIICSVLYTFSNIIYKNKIYKNKIKDLKKGLMQQLLTGKIRVKV